MGRLAHLFICGRRHAAEEAPPPYVATSEKLKSYGPTLVIHGGAGVITRERTPEAQREEYRAVLRRSLEAGNVILSKGGSALDAVEAAVNVMEDSPLFNAGKGAVFNIDGENLLEASIMVSRPPDASVSAARRGAAVTLLRHVKNPISLAKALYLDQSIPHVFMAGEGAEKIAKDHGLDLVDQSYFYTEKRWKDHINNLPVEEGASMGTVGATAVDMDGTIATATSTGGINNKLGGRVGDTPIIGAGTWADETVGTSGTGDGEYFIRTVAAHNVAAKIKYGKSSISQATSEAIEEMRLLGGTGGLIAVDSSGNIAMPMSSPGMYRGYIRSQEGKARVAIFNDEEPK